MENKSLMVDSKDKEQQIKRNEIPLEMTDTPKPSKELLEALKEGKLIEQEIKEGKRVGYSTINEMMDSILK